MDTGGTMSDPLAKALDHFRNPRNVGEVADPDGVGRVVPGHDGDDLTLTFKLDANHRIADVKFTTVGCVSSIAPTSALTEIVKGMTIDEAARVTNEDVARYLEMPGQKAYGAALGRKALALAIRNYQLRLP
jgi:NifU-like protein